MESNLLKNNEDVRVLENRINLMSGSKSTNEVEKIEKNEKINSINEHYYIHPK